MKISFAGFSNRLTFQARITDTNYAPDPQGSVEQTLDVQKGLAIAHCLAWKALITAELADMQETGPANQQRTDHGPSRTPHQQGSKDTAMNNAQEPKATSREMEARDSGRARGSMVTKVTLDRTCQRQRQKRQTTAARPRTAALVTSTPIDVWMGITTSPPNDQSDRMRVRR